MVIGVMPRNESRQYGRVDRQVGEQGSNCLPPNVAAKVPLKASVLPEINMIASNSIRGTRFKS